MWIGIDTMKVTPLKKKKKKEQRKFHARKRRDWNGLKPTTRVVKSKKVYDRKRLSKPEEEWSCTDTIIVNKVYTEEKIC